MKINQKKNLRFSVYRSLKNLHVQIIDDTKGITLFGISSLKEKGSLSDKAIILSEKILKHLRSKKIKCLRFDRGKFKYHGSIKLLADKLREGGIKI